MNSYFVLRSWNKTNIKLYSKVLKKVLTAQDNTAVFSDWNDDETQYWSLVSTEEETVF